MSSCGTANLCKAIMSKMYGCHIGYKIVIYVTDIQDCNQWK